MAINILLIENDSETAVQVEEQLKGFLNEEICFFHANRLSTAIQELAVKSFEVILLAPNLPDSRGPKSIHEISQRFPQIPLVVLSSFEPEVYRGRLENVEKISYLVKGQMTAQELKDAVFTSLVK